jgi:hypothetical protein
MTLWIDYWLLGWISKLLLADICVGLFHTDMSERHQLKVDKIYFGQAIFDIQVHPPFRIAADTLHLQYLRV